MESFEIEAAPLERACVRSNSSGSSREGVGRQSVSNKNTWWDILNPFRLLSRSTLERHGTLGEEFHETTTSENKDENFSDLEMLQFIQTGFFDLNGQATVLIIAKHLPATVISPERISRFILLKLEAIATEKHYSVVYIHTGSSYWTNSPGVRWLWNSYSSSPPWCRAKLQQVYVVHPDLQLHASMWLLCRWMSDRLWSKVHFFVRLEFLWDHFAKDALPLPTSVYEHDQELEDHPLMDYGIITSKEWSPPGGPDLARYQ
ncbi:hypothetical protein BSKO_13334 [Bryopsis sp. KO-2023]|nr:hypothetical protein BSKO_13334 [Bryopsis sp. KO-2023]